MTYATPSTECCGKKVDMYIIQDPTREHSIIQEGRCTVCNRWHWHETYLDFGDRTNEKNLQEVGGASQQDQR